MKEITVESTATTLGLSHYVNIVNNPCDHAVANYLEQFSTGTTDRVVGDETTGPDFGSAMHAVMAAFHKKEIQKDEEFVLLNGKGLVMPNATAQAFRLLRAFPAAFDPGQQVLEVEPEELQAKIPGGLVCTMRPDLVYAEGAPLVKSHSKVQRDYKTSRSRPSSNLIDHYLDALRNLVYSWIYREHHGVWPKTELFFLVTTKTPQYYSLFLPQEDEEVIKLKLTNFSNAVNKRLDQLDSASKNPSACTPFFGRPCILKDSCGGV